MFSANEIALVQDSFAKLRPIQPIVGDLFYDRLFAIAPELRPLFPRDFEEQKSKLMGMIETMVAGLSRLDTLVGPIKALGARHASYGVTMAHYAVVAEALLWTLECGLRGAFTPDVKAAWTKLYRLVAATMQVGAAEVAELRAAE